MGFTCGYGVRPLRTIFIGVITIMLFSFIYWKGEGITRLQENNIENNQTVSFWDALYFSVVTFTTVGYGDWYPKDRFRKFVMIERIIRLVDPRIVPGNLSKCDDTTIDIIGLTFQFPKSEPIWICEFVIK